MPVTFVDIAVYFSAEEWKNLADWQKDLYNNLLKENYESLLAFGITRLIGSPPVSLYVLTASPRLATPIGIRTPVVKHCRSIMSVLPTVVKRIATIVM